MVYPYNGTAISLKKEVPETEKSKMEGRKLLPKYFKQTSLKIQVFPVKWQSTEDKGEEPKNPKKATAAHSWLRIRMARLLNSKFGARRQKGNAFKILAENNFPSKIPYWVKPSTYVSSLYEGRTKTFKHIRTQKSTSYVCFLRKFLVPPPEQEYKSQRGRLGIQEVGKGESQEA